MENTQEKKLKVGIVSDTFFPEIGGGEVHVANLSLFLKNRQNCEVEIFTNSEGGENDFHGIKVFHNDRLGNRVKRFFRDFKYLWEFIKRFDIIHGHYNFYLSALSSVICKLQDKPFVVTLHGLGTLDTSVNKAFRRRIFRWISFKLAHKAIGTSEEMVDVAKRFLPDSKIILITNGTDTEKFKPISKEKKPGEKIIVLSMRRLNAKNGVQYLIESIPYILEKEKNIEFWVSGEDRLFDYIKNRIDELKIGEYVKLIGNVQPDDVKDYLDRVDIVTFPSSAESTSIACLEAMSMEKTIVASALEAFRLMLGEDRGILVKLFERESSDYDAPLTLPEDKIRLLADAVVKAAQNQNLRKELGEKARKFVVENFDWKVLTGKIKDVYLEVLRK